MEGLSPLHKVVAGIDVHRMLHVITVLVENEDGTLTNAKSIRVSTRVGSVRYDNSRTAVKANPASRPETVNPP
ncbi:MAG: hypothetical protein D0528_01055 [Methylococcales bacterium]|nr:MAG: hypothetical protein D0528_01055 [Methylococcales bacterium]